MADFQDVVKGLKDNKTSQDDGFNRLEAAVKGTDPKSIVEEKAKKEENTKKKEQAYFLSIAKGIATSNQLLREGFKGMMDSKSGLLGGIAALLIGPIGMLGAFLKELATSITLLYKFYGKGLVKLTAPFIALYRVLEKLGKKFMGIGKNYERLGRVFLFLNTLPITIMKALGRLPILKQTLELFKAMGTAFNKEIIPKIKNIGTSIRSFITSIGTAFKNFKDLAKLGLNFNKLQVSTQGFTAFQRGIVSVFKTIGNFIRPVTDAVKGIMNFLKTTKSVGTLTNVFGKISGAFKAIGSVLGKIFAPVLIVMGAIEVITGFVDGFKKDKGGIGSKILSGIEGAFKGLVNFLVSAPLDLIKSIISWAAGKLGFKNAEKALDNFSFAKIFDDIIGAVFKGVRGAVDFIGELFSFPKDGGVLAAIGKILDIVTAPIQAVVNFVRGMFGFDVDKDGKKLPPFSFTNLLKDGIGDAIEKIGKMFSSIFKGIEKFVRKALPDAVGDALFGKKVVESVSYEDAVGDLSKEKSLVRDRKTAELFPEFTNSVGGARGAFDKLLKATAPSTQNPNEMRSREITENALSKSASGSGSTTVIQNTQVDNSKQGDVLNNTTTLSSLISPDTIIGRNTQFVL